MERSAFVAFSYMPKVSRPMPSFNAKSDLQFVAVFYFKYFSYTCVITSSWVTSSHTHTLYIQQIYFRANMFKIFFIFHSDFLHSTGLEQKIKTTLIKL